MNTEEKQWLKARQQASQRGITLTRRKNKEGEYVCYLSKKARTSVLLGL